MAALLSLAVLMGWQALFPPPPLVEPAPEVEAAGFDSLRGGAQSTPSGTAGATVTEAGAASGPVASQAETPAAEAAEILDPIVGSAGARAELATDRWHAVFDATGARLISMTLLKRHGADGSPVELVRPRESNQPYPFSTVDRSGLPLALDSVPFAITERSRDQLVFRYRGAEGDVTKTFNIDERGLLGYDIAVSAPASWSLWFGPGVANPEWADFDDRFSKTARQASVMREEMESRQSSKVEETEIMSGAGASWFSLEDKYFLMAIVPDQQVAEIAFIPVRTTGSEEEGLQGYVRLADDLTVEGPAGVGLVASPQGAALSGTSFWGAKEYTELRALPYGLEETVRFGMFGVIARPLLYGLRWIHSNVTSNWGWSIVLMTFAINLVLFPLRHKSYISMQKMQKLNPRMESIRGKFRPKLRDKQGKPNLEMQRKMNEEIQGLFKEEGVNPAMGCLPLLIQMPVFFAFYRLLSQAVELQGAPWVGWIADLSLQDPYKALPLLMGATQFLQTKTMPPATNPTQRILMNTMPIWFTFFAFTFPSGLVLYWLTNNVLTIVQQGGYNQLKKAGYLGGTDEPPKKSSNKSAKRDKAD